MIPSVTIVVLLLILAIIPSTRVQQNALRRNEYCSHWQIREPSLPKNILLPDVFGQKRLKTHKEK